MSIKSFIKEHSPDFIFFLLSHSYMIAKTPYSFVKRFYKALKAKRIIAKAEKFRVIYQDELSKKILTDCEEYIAHGDDIVFIRRALSKGITFCDYHLYKADGRGRFTLREKGGNWHLYDDRTPGIESKYSNVVLLYDEESEIFERVQMFLNVCDGLKNYKLMKVNELSKGSQLFGDEIIISAIKSNVVRRRVERYLYSRSLGGYFVRGLLWYNSEDQYFDVFSPAENETILDVGSYNGMTAIRFLKWGGEKIRKIYTFDFDPENIKKCKENLKGYNDRITLIEKGTWDRDETVILDSSFVGTGSSRVSKKGKIAAQLTTIDSIVKNEPVTFIKMDIEGAELKALHGAKDTIIRNKPRLAISVYHKPEDIYEIPEYILSLVPEYKFYLRHYSSTFAETILYAYCG